MQKNNSVTEDVLAEEKKKLEDERQKLVEHIVKLPNGATFTRLKPVHVA